MAVFRNLFLAAATIALIAGPTHPGAAQAQQSAFGAAQTGESGEAALYRVFADAYWFSPDLRSRRAALLAQGERVPQAAAGKLPRLALTGSTGASTTFSDGPTVNNRSVELGLSGSLRVFDGGATDNGVAQERASIAAAFATLAASEQTVLTDAVIAYLDVFRDREILLLTGHNRNVLRELTRAAKIRFEVGEITRTDVAQAEARLADADRAVSSAEGDLKASIESFRATVGRAPTTIALPQWLPPAPASRAGAEERAFVGSPRLAAARETERASVYAVKAALSGLLPTVDLNTSVTTGFSGSDWPITDSTTGRATLSFNAPIYQGGSLSSRVRQARHTAAQRRLEYIETVRQVRQTAASAWDSVEVARNTVRASRESVRAAEVAREGVRQELVVGARSTLDLLNAEQDLLNARISQLRAVVALHTAGYRLLAAMGALDPDGLGLGRAIANAASVEGPIGRTGYPRDATTAWRYPWRP